MQGRTLACRLARFAAGVLLFTYEQSKKGAVRYLSAFLSARMPTNTVCDVNPDQRAAS